MSEKVLTSDLQGLPTWEECKAKVDADRANPLAAFIYENETALSDRAQEFFKKCLPNYSRRDDEQFRAALAAAIVHCGGSLGG